MEKLGRCRQCMVLNVILLLTSGFCWWWSFDGVAVYRVMAAMATLAAAVLMVAHLIMAVYYAIIEKR